MITAEAILEISKDLVREDFNQYTRKAFNVLPKLDKRHILDVGQLWFGCSDHGTCKVE